MPNALTTRMLKLQIMNTIYHIKPKGIFGDLLMPLNTIKTINKEVYKSAVKKYKGREVILEFNIPFLNCKWNDVLFFSPVHPEKFKTAYLEIGLEWKPIKWLELDVNKVNDFVKNAAIYKHDVIRKKGEHANFPEEYEPFSINRLDVYREIPEATLAHYKRNVHTKKAWLLNYVPHILYKGQIELDLFEELTI